MEKNKVKMLITGVSGLLGNNLAYYFKDKYQILGLYNSHPVTLDNIATDKCDLFDSTNIKKNIAEYNPGIIIHCASLTDIDKCEADRETTRKINVIATRDIVEVIDNKNVKLIYISSDSVYDGVKGDFSETDDINPQNFYGLSKYEGETEVLKLENSLVFRTNIFGWNIQDKMSLGEWILDNLIDERKINGFEDVFFSSIYTGRLAEIIEEALNADLRRIYNCGSHDCCSKYAFAQKIAQSFNCDAQLIRPISIDRSGLKARRGKNLSLNVSKLETALGHELPNIDASVAAFRRDEYRRLPFHRKEVKSQPERFLQYGRQWINNDDILAVVNVLRSLRITQGPTVQEFEKKLAGICQSRYAVAANSGTSALHMACMALGIGPGDEVITSPNTFVASANCAVYCGAKPVFADIDPDTYNISPLEIEKRLTPKTRAIIPVHFAGQSCDMIAIRQVIESAQERFKTKIFVIEDASHALGSSYCGEPVGSCRYSDMAVTSFHPVKHITTGEGGAVLTNGEEFFTRLIKHRSHGITNTPSELIYREHAFCDPDRPLEEYLNPWYYEQQTIGFNYRITDIQCALGSSQLNRLDLFKQRRRKIVDHYNDAFLGIESLTRPHQDERCDSNFHLYVLLFDFESIGIDRRTLMLNLRDNGIQTQVHYIPVHTQPFYQKHYRTGWGDYPIVEKYYHRCLSIPLFPEMGLEEAERVVRNILKFIGR